MNETLSFLIENYETIVGVLVVIASFIFGGKKRAKKILMEHLDTARDNFMGDIKENTSEYATYVYGKLPKDVKVFVSKKMLEKAILTFVDKLKDLDK